MLLPGDPAPYFSVASSVNPKFHFDTAAGRYVVISFFGSTRAPASQRFLAEVAARGGRFDVTSAVFFGVTADPADVPQPGAASGRIFFYDLDLAVSRAFGVVAGGPEVRADPSRYLTKTFVMDPSLRVLAVFGITDDTKGQADKLFQYLDTLPPLDQRQQAAPVITVPFVFEPALCRELIAYYERHGGTDSGFMRDVDGRTVALVDYAHKRRSDCEITDPGLIRTVQERLSRRVVPAIKRAYQFDVTRIERNIVACYDAAEGAHFKAHRDNTTLGTAHRRFAVTINLNAEAYDGAELWFPEFGPNRHKGPTGSATVFSCSLLHEVVRVTRGKRYAFLPFLYDDAAAAVRVANRKYLATHTHRSAGKPADCAADIAPVPTTAGPTLDGACGCGNPNGCGTCLTAAVYPIGLPSR